MEAKESSSSTLPSELYVLKLIESHSLEMNSLINECKTKSPKLMSQRLPRFMRRRAASHNPKRVPKSVRQLSSFSHKTETIPNSKNQKKRKKYVNKEKRESSLKRRQQNDNRTVLHLWFAKRFKMKIHWNRWLPEKNTTKNERILYQNSRNNFVIYYLFYYNCLEIDYSKSNRQQLIAFLSTFSDSQIGCTFGAKIFESDKREGITVLYEHNSYPFKPLVSSYFLWNKNFSKLWLWIHISVYERVFQLLTEFSQNDSNNRFVFNKRNKQLERFRLIGPKALHLFEKCYKFEAKRIQSNEFCEDSVHYLRVNNNNDISITDSIETNLFEDNQKCLSLQKTSNTFDLVMILKNKTYNNRFTIDLIVSSNSAKILWQKITENRGHKTGGLHDLQMIAFNTSSLLFPTFGFIDVKENEMKLKKLKELLKIESEKVVYVIRNESIILKLSQNVTTFSISQYLDFNENKIGLVYIEMVCVNRGVPQLNDIICVPTQNELQRVNIGKYDINISDEIESKEEYLKNKRKIIGLIEFGKYSLEMSRGKGLGVITITSLKELIEINEKIKFKDIYKNKLFVSFKSLKSGLYRLATIKVIGSLFST